jgi:hypothetical protein
MTKGVILFASNNSMTNYLKQANWLASRIRSYLDLPTTLITDDDVKNKFPEYTANFDQIINVDSLKSVYANRRYHDGSIANRMLPFNNGNRALAYELTPYDETIVMDTDFIVSNNLLNYCFKQSADFLIYDTATHLGTYTDSSEFKNISDTSVKFYWATVFFFRKTEENKIFFDLIKHIQDNYLHYRSVYQFKSNIFRNDFAFSIAIHIMNGYQSGNFAGKLPGKHYYIIDKDVLHKLKNDEFTVMVEKPNRLGEYTLVKIKGSNLHVMNKFSLERCIDNQ